MSEASRIQYVKNMKKPFTSVKDNEDLRNDKKAYV